MFSPVLPATASVTPQLAAKHDHQNNRPDNPPPDPCDVRVKAKSNLVAAGHDLAVQVCAACQVVENDQKSAPILKPPAPSFSAIAQRNDQSEASLRKFLSTLHRTIGRTGKMSNWLLADSQIDEIVPTFSD